MNRVCGGEYLRNDKFQKNTETSPPTPEMII